MDGKRETKRINSVRDLDVYQKAFETAIDKGLFAELDENLEHIFAMLNTMEKKVDTFVGER